jgi:hypothetical protein
MDEIVLRLSTVDGESRIVRCSTLMTLEEAAAEAQFQVPEWASLIFAFKGRELAGYLSLHFHNIRTGSHIAMAMSGRNPTGIFQDVALCRWENPYSPGDQLEERRLADLGFANWENHRGYRKEMLALTRQREAEDERDPPRAFPTVIQPASVPSEAPLPTRFKRQSNRRACSWMCGQIDW